MADLVSTNSYSPQYEILVHNGFSASIQFDFQIGNQARGLAWDSDDEELLIAYYNVCKVHDGLTTILKSQFSLNLGGTGQHWGLDIIGNDVIALGSHTVPANQVAVFQGKSSTIRSTFAISLTWPDQKQNNRDIVWTGVPAAVGISTGLTSTRLTDSGQNWEVNVFIGMLLNPDTSQTETFTVTSNTATQIFVSGNMTSVATVGDDYYAGDPGTQNLITSHAYSAGAIYVHKGFTTEEDHSFTPPGSDLSALTWKADTEDLVSAIESGGGTVYRHSGATSTILQSFSYPETGPRGLTFAVYAPTEIYKNFIYDYDIVDYDLVNQDLPYSYAIGGTIGADLSYSYNIRFPHADLSYSYDIKINADFEYSYDIHALISTDLPYSYHIAIGTEDFPYSYNILVKNDFPYEYDILDWGALIIAGYDNEFIYTFEGLTVNLLDTVPFPGDPAYKVQALGWDGDYFEGNLLACLIREIDPKYLIVKFVGTSSIISESFTAPYEHPSGIVKKTVGGTEYVLSCDSATGKIYVHDGFTSITTDEWRVGRTLWGLDIHKDGYLVSFENFPGWGWFQLHSGITSTITTTMRPTIYPPLYKDIKDICLVSGQHWGMVENNQFRPTIYVFSGYSSTELLRRHAPDSVECRGITYGAYMPAVQKDFPYSYEIGLSGADLPYSYDIAAVSNDLSYQYDINLAADLEYSYDLGLFKDLEYAYSILSYYSGLQELTDVQIYIVEPLSILVDLLIWVCSEISPMFDLEIVIAQFFQEDIDVQIRSGRTVPTHRIQILIDGVIHNLDADEINIGIINQYLEKDYGISRIGNVRIYLTNTADKYSVENPSSLIVDEDYIWTWIRIRTGWGPDLETDVETQFQGKLYELITTEAYGCVLSVYDPMKDLMDWETTADITFDAALVASTDLLSLNPLHIIKYLIEDVYVKDAVYGLKWFDFDTSTETDIIDTVSFDLAYEATIHTTISSTLWEKGSNLLEMIQDLLKIVGGYMFTAPDGKLKFYVPSPARSFGTVNSYTGNIDADPRQLFTSSTKTSYDSIYNEIIWKVGASSTLIGPFSATSSIGRFGKRTKEITTKWEVTEENLELLSERLLARFSEPLQQLDGELSYIEAGTALSEELGNVVNLTDQAHVIASKFFEITKIGKKLSNESVEIETRDASQMAGKFMIACSTIDHGDGNGITADQFSLWVERFGFAGWAYVGDPHNSGAEVGFDPDGNHNYVIDPDYGTQDRWGNGIEEIFVAW